MSTHILRNVNLNLLPILQVLLKTRSVSATANALGISQPAVSDALSRLRATLDDQLLVRVGSRLKLTNYAECLIDPLDAVCADLEAFLTKDTFNPRTARREFVIATSDLGGYLLARPILDMLVRDAPHASLQLIDIGIDLATRLAAREIDIALLPEFSVEDMAPAPLRFQTVMDMPRVVLMRQRHPLAQSMIVSDQDVSRYRHIAFQPDPIPKASSRLLMTTNGVPVEFLARLGHALLIPHMLSGTDFLAIVPQQFGEDVAAPLGLECRPMSNSGPSLRFGFAWSPVQDRDPAHSWFRSAIAEHLSKVARPASRGTTVRKMAADPQSTSGADVGRTCQPQHAGVTHNTVDNHGGTENDGWGKPNDTS